MNGPFIKSDTLLIQSKKNNKNQVNILASIVLKIELFWKILKSVVTFYSRFVELHFSELPSTELAYIIEKRCKISTKASKKLISVMHDLQVKFENNAKSILQWGLEYRTSLVFGWSIVGQFRSQPFLIRTFKMAALA